MSHSMYTIYIAEFPADVQTLENGWKSFKFEEDESIVIRVRPAQFKKLEKAQADFPFWTAGISAIWTPLFDRSGYVLDDADIEVRKYKPLLRLIKSDRTCPQKTNT